MEEHPFTVNYHYLSEYKSNFLAYYKSARDKETRAEVTSQIESFDTQATVSPTPFNWTNTKNTQPFGGFSSFAELPAPGPTGIAKVLAGLTEMGIVGIKPQDLYRILPPDEMEPAINIMADVRAYFQGAISATFPPCIDE